MMRALSFLTVFGRAAEPNQRTLSWFPLVGVAVGAVVGAAWWLAGRVWPAAVAAVVAVAVDAAVTGCLHLDGLADAADGLLPAVSRERRLEIMADPRVGAFGAVALVLVLSLRAAALAVTVARPLVVVGLWCGSRTMMAVVARSLPSAHADGGTASDFVGDRRSTVERYGVAGYGMGLAFAFAAVGAGGRGLVVMSGGGAGDGRPSSGRGPAGSAASPATCWVRRGGGGDRRAAGPGGAMRRASSSASRGRWAPPAGLVLDRLLPEPPGAVHPVVLFGRRHGPGWSVASTATPGRGSCTSWPASPWGSGPGSLCGPPPWRHRRPWPAVPWSRRRRTSSARSSVRMWGGRGICCRRSSGGTRAGSAGTRWPGPWWNRWPRTPWTPSWPPPSGGRGRGSRGARVSRGQHPGRNGRATARRAMRNYGWASARLDDAPAGSRPGCTAALVALVRPRRASAVWAAVREQAPAHPSPNAGVAEAAFAAALGVRLGGTNRYGERVEERVDAGNGAARRGGGHRCRHPALERRTAALAVVLMLIGSARWWVARWACPPPGPTAVTARPLRPRSGLDPRSVLDLSMSLNPVAPDPVPVVARHLACRARLPGRRSGDGGAGRGHGRGAAIVSS